MSLAGFSRIGEITLPSIAGSHSNFVLLLKWADFHADVLSKLDSGGGDLRFSSDIAGSNQLPCEVVQFDKVGSAAQVWVRIPTAATGQTVQVWGDKTGEAQPAATDPFGRNATWSDFEAVLHMQEIGTDGVFTDSTGNGHNTTLTTGSSLTTTTTAHPFGGSWADFTGLEALTLTNSAQMLNNSAMHMSAWVNADLSDVFDGLVGNRYNTFSDNEWFAMQLATRTFAKSGSEDIFLGGNIATGVTTRLVGAHDATSLQSFTNGTLNGEDTSIAVTGGITSQVGQDYRIATYFSNVSSARADGRIGEVRLARYKPSSSLVLTEYQNQSSVGAWVTMAPVTSGTSIDVNATLGQINYTSQPTTVQLTGDIDVNPTLGTIAYNSHSATVQLSGDIDVISTLGTINYTSNNTQVQLAGEINVTATLGQINYTSQNATVNLDGGITANATLGQINYTSQPATVTLQGSIEVNATLGSIVYNSNNSIVQIGEGQKITIVTAGFKPDSITSQFKPDSITATFRTN